MAERAWYPEARIKYSYINDSLGFRYIEARHVQSTCQINQYWKKLTQGGIEELYTFIETSGTYVMVGFNAGLRHYLLHPLNSTTPSEKANGTFDPYKINEI